MKTAHFFSAAARSLEEHSALVGFLFIGCCFPQNWKFFIRIHAINHDISLSFIEYLIIDLLLIRISLCFVEYLIPTL